MLITESPPQLVEHCSSPRMAASSDVEPNVFDIADISKRLTYLIRKDHFGDEETWTKSVWALRRAFGDVGWPLAEKISYADDQNRLSGVWKRDDANKASPSTCASLIDASNKAGYREWARERIFEDLVLPEGTAPALVPVIQNAATLLKRDFADVRYVIPGYIAEGCSILAGKPKIGKSWFVLDAALAVAGGNGGLVFGQKAVEGDVLYLALEDNERRLKSRIKKVLPLFAGGPERFTYATEWKRADEGGLEAIEAWIKSVPKATLVIVDVLARFRPMATGRSTAAYDADYAAISGLQGLASKYSVAIVIVHHLRKNAQDNDPFDKVSGTLGLSGAADTILIIDRDGQGVTLYGRGRDIEEIETAVTFEKSCCRWKVMGAASEIRQSSARKTIMEVLKGSSAAMSPADIAAETGMKAANVRFLVRKMVEDGTAMKAERGKYLLDLVPPLTSLPTLADASTDVLPRPLASIELPPALPTTATNRAPPLPLPG